MNDPVTRQVFRVQFHNAGKIYELYVREVQRAPHLFGFIELRSFLFHKPTQVVIDPSEEKLRVEFGEVESTCVPLHSVIRIDEVKRPGIAKIKESDGSNVTPFPGKVPEPSG